MSLLEDAWEEREEVVYPEVFGDTGPGIYPLSNDVFEQLDAQSVDPRWLTHGVFQSPPNDTRNTWVYVTSGMSNPWESDEPQDYSGFGVEFVLETEQASTWAINVLHTLMAYNLMLASGQMGEPGLLDYGDRIPFALSDDIAAMVIAPTFQLPENIDIKSGRVDFLQIVGVTEAELTYAQETSSEALIEMLIEETGGLITAKQRKSVV
ncbi:suppressor of fused domain protein [Marisediminitalea sp.]|uniref:suppressor of fused domain protein n=1 Tax=Marisediminitalea sp. TaxID=2662268 RepID=UPI00337E0FD4|nr:suppressor of fused domain protein [Aestuariibacter sp.]